MNGVEAIFFLEMMKNTILGGMQKNLKTMNKFEAIATNSMLEKQVEALEIAIKFIKETIKDDNK